MDVRIQATVPTDLSQEPRGCEEGDTGKGLQGHLDLEFDLVLEKFGVLGMGLVKDKDVRGRGKDNVHEETAEEGDMEERNGLTEEVVILEGVEGQSCGCACGDNITGNSLEGVKGCCCGVGEEEVCVYEGGDGGESSDEIRDGDGWE